MIRVSVIGAGKVGKHFIHECLQNALLELVQVYNRSPFTKEGVHYCNDLLKLEPADIFVVCVKDDVISTLQLNHLQGLVVHTSGTVSINSLTAIRKGVLYPLQTFSNHNAINFKNLQCCLEVKNLSDQTILSAFCSAFSEQIYWLNENQRQKLHLAAVFANNFSTHIMGIAKNICDEANIPSQILNNLIMETLQQSLSPYPHQQQTGPAVRNDFQTISHHLAQLKDTHAEIYEILTKSIQEIHGSKL